MLDEAAIDALADAKAEIGGKLKALFGDGFDTKGKTIPEIRRMAVARKFGDVSVKDKSDDYVEARFDAMIADSKAPAMAATIACTRRAPLTVLTSPPVQPWPWHGSPGR